MNDSTIIKNLSRLKFLRESKKITQVKLSIDLGVSQELISRYERGSSFPQPNMLIKLADYFNCSIDYLLGRTDIVIPAKYTFSNSTEIKNSEIINKYNSLSNENKKHFECFLDYLVNK